MAGKEVSGVAAADATLFHNRIYCLTPTDRTDPTAVSKVTALIEILGARVRYLEPEKHDQLVAQVSHLPFIVSSALMTSVVKQDSWGEASSLAATGFRDASRLAAGSPEMYRDICLTNRESIVQSLDEYMATLQAYREAIASGDTRLYELFVRAQEARQEWQAAFDPGE
jgi:prephenate dehydrogenase